MYIDNKDSITVFNGGYFDSSSARSTGLMSFSTLSLVCCLPFLLREEMSSMLRRRLMDSSCIVRPAEYLVVSENKMNV
jgi:hypothetical protein